MLLSKSVALVEGLAAFALLAGLQYLVAWLSVRSPRFGDLVKSEPTLLLRRGRFLEGAMRAQRVTRAEILAALRSSGAIEAGQVAAVVLETDGSLSVIQNSGRSGPIDVLEGVGGADGVTTSRTSASLYQNR